MRRILRLLLISFLFWSVNGFADDEKKIDAILALPKSCQEGIFERTILESYYDYLDLNRYLLHLNKPPLFCIPKKGFNPLDLIPLVITEMKNKKYSYPGPQTDTEPPVVPTVAAILINKFPCNKK